MQDDTPNQHYPNDAPMGEVATPAQRPAMLLQDVQRRYLQASEPLDVLRGVNLALWAGQSVALIAPSGAGKSTLLHLAGLLERPEGGEIWLGETPTAHLGDRQRTAMRRLEIGFVYQFHHLLGEFSALENVMMPQLIRGISKPVAASRATELLTYLGLGPRLAHRPAELSGGEQQRVAIARAVANGPRVLLADEPTGNLDPRTADLVFGALTQLVRASGLAALVATHNLELARRMDRRVALQDGLLVELE